MNDKDSSFQNIISILGLVAAFIAAMVPLFSQSELSKYIFCCTNNYTYHHNRNSSVVEHHREP